MNFTPYVADILRNEATSLMQAKYITPTELSKYPEKNYADIYHTKLHDLANRSSTLASGLAVIMGLGDGTCGADLNEQEPYIWFNGRLAGAMILRDGEWSVHT